MTASALAIATAVHAQSTTPAPPVTSAPPAATGTQYPPSRAIVFFLAHPELIATTTSSQNVNGKDYIDGSQTNVADTRAAMNNWGGLDAASRNWIETNVLANNNNSSPMGNQYAIFMASIAAIKEQAIQKSAAETALALNRKLGESDAVIQNWEQKIQGYQDDIDAARARVLDYAAAAIRAERQAAGSGGGSADASGSGSGSVDGEQTVIDEVNTIVADGVQEGNAIARAYVDPTGLLNGANQTLSSAEVNAMLQRLAVAATATSATPTSAPAGTGDFTSTASGSPLTVTALNPIYKNYKVTVGPNGALVVSVPTLQVQTPTGVMTIPSNQVTVPSTQMDVTSTQINVPSTQVNVPTTQVNTPSTQVNVPSLQTNVPSTQVQTPSAVMTSPDLQPALCGR